MERLTFTDAEMKKIGEDFSCPVKNNPEDDCDLVTSFCDRVCDEFQNNCPFLKFAQKLKYYEDTEESGLLVKLPCKLGDMLWTNYTMSGWYFRSKDAPYPVKVVFIGLNESEEMGYGFFNVEFEKADCMMAFDFSDIGKTVFLTKEEAEATIKNN